MTEELSDDFAELNKKICMISMKYLPEYRVKVFMYGLAAHCALTNMGDLVLAELKRMIDEAQEYAPALISEALMEGVLGKEKQNE